MNYPTRHPLTSQTETRYNWLYKRQFVRLKILAAASVVGALILSFSACNKGGAIQQTNNDTAKQAVISCVPAIQ